MFSQLISGSTKIWFDINTMVAYLKIDNMKSKLFQLITGAFFILLLVFTIQSCKKEEVQPVQLVSGGDLETGSSRPNGWWSSTGQGNYDLNWSEEESFSPKKSLKISTQTSNATNFAFWALTINTNIPVGKDVTLKVKVKSKLVGKGISLLIRGDDTVTPAGYTEQASAEGPFISGTHDWQEQSVKMTKVGENIKSLTIYLIYSSNTTGEVYFDDVSLTY